METENTPCERPGPKLDDQELDSGSRVRDENARHAIVPGMLDQVVARAQALSRSLTKSRPNASLDDFLAERALEAQLD